MVVGFIRNLWWGGDPDKLNETSGLTLRDVFAVQNSWAVVHADASKHGLELFKRFDVFLILYQLQPANSYA